MFDFSKYSFYHELLNVWAELWYNIFIQWTYNLSIRDKLMEIKNTLNSHSLNCTNTSHVVCLLNVLWVNPFWINQIRNLFVLLMMAHTSNGIPKQNLTIELNKKILICISTRIREVESWCNNRIKLWRAWRCAVLTLLHCYFPIIMALRELFHSAGKWIPNKSTRFRK